jgi:hypothetical protein
MPFPCYAYWFKNLLLDKKKLASCETGLEDLIGSHTLILCRVNWFWFRRSFKLLKSSTAKLA